MRKKKKKIIVMLRKENSSALPIGYAIMTICTQIAPAQRG
jgi:hypothetical protein